MGRRNASSSGLKALVWDLDGTLAETEELHRQAFNQAFAEAGLDWTWDRDLYARLLAVAGGKERIRRFALGRVPGRVRSLEGMVRDLHERKNKAYAALLAAGGLALRPGVARLLDQAGRAGLALAIATTTSPANVRALLDHAPGAAAPDWSAVVAGDEAPRKKPAPDAYLLVLDRLGLAPGQCLAVEDSANGVRAAKAAGIPVLATPGAYTAHDDFSGALAVLDGLGEPERPCLALCGPPPPAGVADLAWLRILHARATAVRECESRLAAPAGSR
ncbi:MAG: HAD-IA family hydrolase [Thermodesulfobacteriota bacterium]